MTSDGTDLLIPLLFSQFVIVLVALLHIWFRLRTPGRPGRQDPPTRLGRVKRREDRSDDRQ